MTTTPKQLAANRRNAKRSTGPRTPAGKAVSRWNALQHGILSRAVIPPSLEAHESRADFDALLAALRQDLAPAGAVEELLIERLATTYWRLSRLLRAEAAAVAQTHTSRARSAAFEAANRQGQAEQLAAYLEQLPAAFPPPKPYRVAGREDPSDSQVADFRAFMVDIADDDTWDDYPDDELLAAARAYLDDLRLPLAPPDPQDAQLQADLDSFPPLDRACLFARYESMLERQLHSALHALERLQRLRAGDAVPPPLDVAVTLSATDP